MPALKEMVRRAFAQVLKGHVTKDIVLTELKRHKDVRRALAAHHQLPFASNILSHKIVDMVRFLK